MSESECKCWACVGPSVITSSNSEVTRLKSILTDLIDEIRAGHGNVWDEACRVRDLANDAEQRLQELAQEFPSDASGC